MCAVPAAQHRWRHPRSPRRQCCIAHHGPHDWTAARPTRLRRARILRSYAMRQMADLSVLVTSSFANFRLPRLWWQPHKTESLLRPFQAASLRRGLSHSLFWQHLPLCSTVILSSACLLSTCRRLCLSLTAYLTLQGQALSRAKLLAG